MGGYVDLIKARSPYAYWTHEELSGNLADSSGNGRTLITETGAPSYGNRPLLAADARRSISYNASWVAGMTGGDWWNFATAFTLETWIARVTVTGSQTIFGNLSHPAPFLQMVGTAGDVDWWSSSAGSKVTWSATPLCDDHISHLLDFTYDDSSKASELWVDGVSGGVLTAPQAIANTVSFMIGSDNFGALLNARLAHVALYPRILTPAEIRLSLKVGRNTHRAPARSRRLRAA